MASQREFLRRRAAASGVTEALAASAVEACTGRAPRRVERFDGGWGAVPFWATAADGTELVVRVGLGERPYGREAAVIARVRAAGVPAPDVVGVCRIGDHPVSVQVRVAGAGLQELLEVRGADEPQACARCTEAGRWLRRVHEVDPGGLDLTEAETVDDVLQRVERLRGRIPPEAMSVMSRVADRLAPLRDPVPAVLVHGDFGADHVLIDGERVTAVIDWENALRADPARDVAWWQLYDVFMGGGAEAMRAGYGLRGDAFDARVHAWTLVECVNAVLFDVEHDYADGAAGMVERTAALLARAPD